MTARGATAAEAPAMPALHCKDRVFADPVEGQSRKASPPGCVDVLSFPFRVRLAAVPGRASSERPLAGPSQDGRFIVEDREEGRIA